MSILHSHVSPAILRDFCAKRSCFYTRRHTVATAGRVCQALPVSEQCAGLGHQGPQPAGCAGHLQTDCVSQLGEAEPGWSGADRQGGGHQPRTLVGQSLASFPNLAPSRKLAATTSPFHRKSRTCPFFLKKPTALSSSYRPGLSWVNPDLSKETSNHVPFCSHRWQSYGVFFLFFFKLQMLKILLAFELPRGSPISSPHVPLPWRSLLPFKVWNATFHKICTESCLIIRKGLSVSLKHFVSINTLRAPLSALL